MHPTAADCIEKTDADKREAPEAVEGDEEEGDGQGEACTEAVEGDEEEAFGGDGRGGADGDGQGGADGDGQGGDTPLARYPEANHGKRVANMADRLEMDRLQFENSLALQQSRRVTRAHHRKNRAGSFANDVMPQDPNDFCRHEVSSHF